MEFMTQQLSLPLVITDVNHFSVIEQDDSIHEWLKRSVRQRVDGFVVFDPDGYLFSAYGNGFIQDGYRIKVFDTSNLNLGARYNPFVYARGDDDVIKLAASFVAGTKGSGKSGNMKFAVAEKALLTALFSYVSEEVPAYERNLNSVLGMLKYMLPNEDTLRYYNGIDHLHTVDFIFEEYVNRNPHCLAVRRYESFKHMAGNNADSIIQSCIERLKPFCIPAMKPCFSKDDLGFDSFGIYGGYKTVLFVSAGQSDTFDFLAPLLYTQLLDTLCYANMER